MVWETGETLQSSNAEHTKLPTIQNPHKLTFFFSGKILDDSFDLWHQIRYRWHSAHIAVDAIPNLTKWAKYDFTHVDCTVYISVPTIPKREESMKLHKKTDAAGNCWHSVRCRPAEASCTLKGEEELRGGAGVG